LPLPLQMCIPTLQSFGSASNAGLILTIALSINSLQPPQQQQKQNNNNNNNNNNIIIIIIINTIEE
jgi:hypothetical protein